MADLQAVILAGGKGTRLRPVTADLPKPLVPIANRPLVVHQLAHLAAAGVQDVTLALGYGAERFDGVREEAAAMGLVLRVVIEPAPLGTGGALRWCPDAEVFDERPLLWINGDVVATPDVGKLLDFHVSHAASVTFWLSQVRDVTAFGVLELAGDGRVEAFIEKPAPEETTSHLINAGILMLDPGVLRRIPPDSFFSFERQLLPNMVREREALYGLFDGGYWMDTGPPHQYLEANRHVLEGRVGWTPAGHETADGLWEGEGVERGAVSVIRPALLGDRVRLEHGVRLFGRTVLGPDVVIDENAALEDCVVFAGAEIGKGASIVNSIVCAGARIGNGALLENAIVGARAVVGKSNELRGARLWNDVELPDGSLVVDG